MQASRYVIHVRGFHFPNVIRLPREVRHTRSPLHLTEEELFVLCQRKGKAEVCTAIAFQLLCSRRREDGLSVDDVLLLSERVEEIVDAALFRLFVRTRTHPS